MRTLLMSLLLLAPACSHTPATPAAPTATTASSGTLPFMEPPAEPPPGWLPLHRANVLMEEGQFSQALPLFREGWKEGDRKPDNAYSAACAAARLGREDEAMTWLERAVETGFRDAAWLAKDEDLASLHVMPTFVALRDRLPKLPPLREKGAHPELQRLVNEDQADRQGSTNDPVEVRRIVDRDAQRRAQVAELLEAGAAKTGEDYYAAALIYHHGDKLKDFARARELAAEAARLGHPKALRLAALAWDRWLMMAGKPQRFGTQYQRAPDGTEFRLYPVDPSVTDEERARWGIPPLEEISPVMR